MTDVRSKPFQPMTDGSYVVPVRLEFSLDGDTVRIGDHTDSRIGDACAALHQAALDAIGGQILEARNTDAFERKPPDPGKVVNSTEQTQAAGGK